ncbi:TPA: DUF1353 domain-containing protein [Campylobacter jejuni]|nr:DUF1353 domain-containing protein [Campylobacter jejuni]HEG8104693.1 DUF1353 domain-containing protein [Campylobacter jejuni]HEG8133551.1 DUF1353 domain-containing protein [Campylobacter jejuni]
MTIDEIRRTAVKPYDEDKFELIEDYRVNLTVKYKGQDKTLDFIIPAGYKTNGADIPRCFWSMFPPYRSEYFSAVVIHDYLCDMATSRYDYRIADLALRKAMKILDCKYKSEIFYWSCHLFHEVKISIYSLFTKIVRW